MDSFDYYSQDGQYWEDRLRRWCPRCKTRMVYHEWPAINAETGEHLGNYRIYKCEKCGHEVNPNKE
jgi:RNase P subunit RPR2